MWASRPHRSSQRLSALLLVAGAGLGLVGNALHPHSADPDAAAAVRAIAQSGAWVGIHLAIIVAVLLVIGGLVGLAHLLADGPAGPLARLGLAAALLGGAVVCVSTAIDGFGMQALARAWAGAPAAEAGTALRVAAAVQAATFGVWSVGMLVFFGAAFGCFGAAATASGRFPRGFGWTAVAGGAGAAAAALLQLAAGGAVQAAETLFLAASLLLTMWAFALGVLLWRASARPAAAPATAAGPAAPGGLRPSQS
jgi:hypothetical protein